MITSKKLRYASSYLTLTIALRPILVLAMAVGLAFSSGCTLHDSSSERFQQQPRYEGIPSSQMNYFAAAQKRSQWCWAASIQMVLNYYGVYISQEQIVARTYGTDQYGNLPDWPGSWQAITANLNNWNFDNAGRPYVVRASLKWGAPSPVVLLHELSSGRPVIAAYSSGPNSGHAVVITGASYIQTYDGPIVQSVVVRDPWPSHVNRANAGRVEYGGLDFSRVMQAYWYVRVN